jgi:hypothetical protein
MATRQAKPTRRSGGHPSPRRPKTRRRRAAERRPSPPASPVVGGTGARVANTGGVNSVSLIGRIAEPPRMRTLASGEPICALRVAVPRVSRGGVREPGVVYVDVAVTGLRASEVCDLVSIGERIGVAGRIELGEQGAAGGGGERTAQYEVIADQLELLDAPPESEAA